MRVYLVVVILCLIVCDVIQSYGVRRETDGKKVASSSRLRRPSNHYRRRPVFHSQLAEKKETVQISPAESLAEDFIRLGQDILSLGSDHNPNHITDDVVQISKDLMRIEKVNGSISHLRDDLVNLGKDMFFIGPGHHPGHVFEDIRHIREDITKIRDVSNRVEEVALPSANEKAKENTLEQHLSEDVANLGRDLLFIGSGHHPGHALEDLRHIRDDVNQIRDYVLGSRTTKTETTTEGSTESSSTLADDSTDPQTSLTTDTDVTSQTDKSTILLDSQESIDDVIKMDVIEDYSENVTESSSGNEKLTSTVPEEDTEDPEIVRLTSPLNQNLETSTNFLIDNADISETGSETEASSTNVTETYSENDNVSESSSGNENIASTEPKDDTEDLEIIRLTSLPNQNLETSTNFLIGDAEISETGSETEASSTNVTENYSENDTVTELSSGNEKLTSTEPKEDTEGPEIVRWTSPPNQNMETSTNFSIGNAETPETGSEPEPNVTENYSENDTVTELSSGNEKLTSTEPKEDTEGPEIVRWTSPPNQNMETSTNFSIGNAETPETGSEPEPNVTENYSENDNVTELSSGNEKLISTVPEEDTEDPEIVRLTSPPNQNMETSTNFLIGDAETSETGSETEASSTNVTENYSENDNVTELSSGNEKLTFAESKEDTEDPEIVGLTSPPNQNMETSTNFLINNAETSDSETYVTENYSENDNVTEEFFESETVASTEEIAGQEINVDNLPEMISSTPAPNQENPEEAVFEESGNLINQSSSTENSLTSGSDVIDELAENLPTNKPETQKSQDGSVIDSTDDLAQPSQTLISNVNNDSHPTSGSPFDVETPNSMLTLDSKDSFESVKALETADPLKNAEEPVDQQFLNNEPAGTIAEPRYSLFDADFSNGFLSFFPYEENIPLSISPQLPGETLESSSPRSNIFSPQTVFENNRNSPIERYSIFQEENENVPASYLFPVDEPKLATFEPQSNNFEPIAVSSTQLTQDDDFNAAVTPANQIAAAPKPETESISNLSNDNKETAPLFLGDPFDLNVSETVSPTVFAVNPSADNQPKEELSPQIIEVIAKRRDTSHRGMKTGTQQHSKQSSGNENSFNRAQRPNNAETSSTDAKDTTQLPDAMPNQQSVDKSVSAQTPSQAENLLNSAEFNHLLDKALSKLSYKKFNLDWKLAIARQRILENQVNSAVDQINTLQSNLSDLFGRASRTKLPLYLPTVKQLGAFWQTLASSVDRAIMFAKFPKSALSSSQKLSPADVTRVALNQKIAMMQLGRGFGQIEAVGDRIQRFYPHLTSENVAAKLPNYGLRHYPDLPVPFIAKYSPIDVTAYSNVTLDAAELSEIENRLKLILE